jgi:hypothetical protein
MESNKLPNGLILILCYLVFSFFSHIWMFYLQNVANHVSADNVIALCAVIFCFIGLSKRRIWGWKLSILWYTFESANIILTAIIRFMDWHKYMSEVESILQPNGYPLLMQKIYIFAKVFGFILFLVVNGLILKYLFTNRSIYSIPSNLSFFDSLTYSSNKTDDIGEYSCSNCGAPAVIGQKKCIKCGEIFDN